jgi:hypothetical protein
VRWDIAELIRTAGFELESDERMYISGIKAFSYNFWDRTPAAR